MPNNDREVFEHLTSDKDTSLHLDFLAYAVFAAEKREWMKLWESQHQGTAPSQADIDNWISNLTESQFNGMRGSAEGFFLAAADEYLEQQLTEERRNILRNAIVSEVKSASDWRKQLGMALLTAIVAPLILGGLIAAALFYSTYLTPAEIARRLHPPAADQAVPPAPPVQTPAPANP